MNQLRILFAFSFCRSLEDKLSSLRSHLHQLKKGTDPDYLSAVHDLEAIRDNRLFVADVFYQYELAAVEQEFEREKAIAFQHLEAKQQDLRECILQDLQDKRKAYDSYRHGMEVSSMCELSYSLSHSIPRHNISIVVPQPPSAHHKEIRLTLTLQVYV